MVKPRTTKGAGCIGQTSPGSYLAKQTTSKRSSHALVKDPHGCVIRIIQTHPFLADHDHTVGEILLVGKKNILCLGWIDHRVRGKLGGCGSPITKYLGEELFYILLLEVAVHGHDDPVGVKILLVERDHVIPGDGLDCGVLGMGGIGMPFTIDQFWHLALQDPNVLIVTRCDRCPLLFFGQIDLVVWKRGYSKDFAKNSNALINILSQSGNRGRTLGIPDSYFNAGSHGLEFFIKGVARGLCGPAGTHDLTCH